MKTYRSLYPLLCSFENLYAAYRAARRPEVATFEYAQEAKLNRLTRG